MCIGCFYVSLSGYPLFKEHFYGVQVFSIMMFYFCGIPHLFTSLLVRINLLHFHAGVHKSEVGGLA